MIPFECILFSQCAYNLGILSVCLHVTSL